MWCDGSDIKNSSNINFNDSICKNGTIGNDNDGEFGCHIKIASRIMATE